jgi:hypothetical protein
VEVTCFETFTKIFKAFEKRVRLSRVIIANDVNKLSYVMENVNMDTRK